MEMPKSLTAAPCTSHPHNIGLRNRALLPGVIFLQQTWIPLSKYLRSVTKSDSVQTLPTLLFPPMLSTVHNPTSSGALLDDRAKLRCMQVKTYTWCPRQKHIFPQAHQTNNHRPLVMVTDSEHTGSMVSATGIFSDNDETRTRRGE